jgi:hypothetical protein
MVTRLLHVHHTTRIDALAQAFRAFSALSSTQMNIASISLKRQCRMVPATLQSLLEIQELSLGRFRSISLTFWIPICFFLPVA